MTAAERRLAIMELLSVRRHENMTNLSRKFGVCRWTIQQDITILSLSYPIYTTKGKGGGIHISEGFELENPKLSVDQLELLNRVLSTLNGQDKETMLSIINRFGRR